eukprot:Amastigsp_a178766_7.p4 type:complete len:104 gc:universal Amastigsp_a178766_7:477-166(-)
MDIGMPMMMRSETPMTSSSLWCIAASKRMSVVFSNEASMRVDERILPMPKRVMPRTSPRNDIRSARSIRCRVSTFIPCDFIVSEICSMIVWRAASMPSVTKVS